MSMSWWIVAAYLAVAWIFGLWIMVALPLLAATVIVAWAVLDSRLSGDP